jgi:hypothetical protein
LKNTDGYMYVQRPSTSTYMVTTSYDSIPTDLNSYQKKPEVNEIHEKMQRVSVTGLNSKEQEGIETSGKGRMEGRKLR